MTRLSAAPAIILSFALCARGNAGFYRSATDLPSSVPERGFIDFARLTSSP